MRAICDTAVSGEGCTYDLYAQVIGGTVSNVVGEGLGYNDLAGTLGSDTARLSVDTSTEVDGISFDAPPGATVQLTMLLGGEDCVGFIFWKSGGVVRNDTTGNPVDLVPATP
jgi:Na+-translocating ferredoxin:NAD+ oxidoreductase RnfE subunit